MADVSFTCRGYNYGLIGELEYELNRKIGPVEFLVINLPSDPNPVAHFIRVDSTSARTATLTWDGGSPVDGTYLMSLYVVNREGTMSDAMTLEIVVDRAAPVVFISKLLGASVTPSPVNRIHTPTASLTDTAVATVNSIYEGDVKPHTFSLINSYKSSRKYTIDSSTGEIFYDTTKNVISLLTVDRDDITVDSDEISCDATLLETGGSISQVPLNLADLDGSSKSFTSTSGAFSGATALTIMMRVKCPLAVATSCAYFEPRITGLTPRVKLQLKNSGNMDVFLRSVDTDAGYTVASTTGAPLTANQQHTIALVVDTVGNTLKTYVDGVEVTNNNPTPTLSPILSGAYFGGVGTNIAVANANTAQWMDGSVCDVNLWTRAISGAEVTEAYNSGVMKTVADMSTALKVNLQHSFTLSNTGDACVPSGDEILDNVGSMVLTNNGTTLFTESGVSAECFGAPTPLDGTVHEVGYMVTDSRDTYSGTAKFVYKDTTFTGGIV